MLHGFTCNWQLQIYSLCALVLSVSLTASPRVVFETRLYNTTAPAVAQQPLPEWLGRGHPMLGLGSNQQSAAGSGIAGIEGGTSDACGEWYDAVGIAASAAGQSAFHIGLATSLTQHTTPPMPPPQALQQPHHDYMLYLRYLQEQKQQQQRLESCRHVQAPHLTHSRTGSVPMQRHRHLGWHQQQSCQHQQQMRQWLWQHRPQRSNS